MQAAIFCPQIMKLALGCSGLLGGDGCVPLRRPWLFCLLLSCMPYCGLAGLDIGLVAVFVWCPPMTPALPALLPGTVCDDYGSLAMTGMCVWHPYAVAMALVH